MDVGKPVTRLYAHVNASPLQAAKSDFHGFRRPKVASPASDPRAVIASEQNVIPGQAGFSGYLASL
jgi:hypothetical protein